MNYNNVRRPAASGVSEFTQSAEGEPVISYSFVMLVSAPCFCLILVNFFVFISLRQDLEPGLLILPPQSCERWDPAVHHLPWQIPSLFAAEQQSMYDRLVTFEFCPIT